MEPRHEIVLASDVTRDAMTAEVWLDEELWSILIDYDDRPLVVEQYPRRDGTPWVLPAATATNLLQRAMACLRPPAA